MIILASFLLLGILGMLEIDPVDYIDLNCTIMPSICICGLHYFVMSAIDSIGSGQCLKGLDPFGGKTPSMH